MTTKHLTDINAKHAIRAARNRRIWGLYAARRYCERRGVPFALYRLACQLDAAERVGA